MDSICEKPMMKLLYTELKKNNVDTLTVTDGHLVRKNIYNAGMQVLPNIPTSI